MSRVRLASLALFAVATLAACAVPTAPTPASTGATPAPSYDVTTEPDTSTSASRSGYQVGNG